MTSLLILHGWGSSAKNWERVRELLENHGCKVFVPDLPGFGENPPLSKPWSIDDYAEWARDYCEENELSQFFMLGHSFGGAIALKYSLKFPQDIKKLFLVDPAIIRVKDIRKEILAKISKIFKKFSFLPFYPLVRRAFYKFIVRKSDYLDTMGATRETYLKAIKEDFSYYLTSILVPTVLIWGEKDDVTPLRDAYLVKERISGAELEILSGIHHNPQTEAPEILAKKILNFIKL